MIMQLFSATVFIVTIAAVTTYASAACYSQGLTSAADFVVQCKRSSNERPTYEVKVICRSNDWTKFTDVDLDLSSVEKITFQNCSFPATMNTQSILRSMNIEVGSTLTFREFHSTTNRQNLKGLSVTVLRFVDSDFKKLPFDLLYDVLSIKVLEIGRTQLECIPGAFFGDWAQNVSAVLMSRNRIQKITRHDFSRLVNVNIIDLDINIINEIEAGAFDGLHRLHTLRITNNHLHVLPSGIFQQLGRLAALYLGSNSFDKLPQDLISNTKKLTEFNMEGNNGTLATLPNGLFKNLIHLEYVYLRVGALKSLPSDLFTGCSQLKLVSLNNNRLKSLPSGLFDDTRNLRSLHIGSNHLESLPAYIFKRFHRLDKLHINKNNLSSLMPEHLEGLQSVDEFDASDNNLTRLADQFITYLKSASDINLSNNQISFCSPGKIKSPEYKNRSSSVNGLTGTFADTSQNQTFQQFDLDPRKIKGIKIKINLRQNNITEFNADVVSMMGYSDSIDLRNNRISKIDLSDFSLGHLMRTITDSDGVTSTGYLKVYLENNPLHCDCKIMDFVRYLYGWRGNKLYNIFVESNFTCASPPELENRQLTCTNWKELNCLLETNDTNDACNEICICQEYPGKRLLSVNCSHRNLTQPPPMIGNVNNWSIELNMSGNKLQHTPSLSGSYLKNIAILDLSYNNITRVTIDLFSPKLQILKLHGNGISHLDSDIITHLDRNNILNDFTLHDNPWICDCETRRFLNFVQKKFTNYNFHDVRCYGTNGKLYKMTVSEICKDVITIVIIASLSITFIGIIVACLVAFYYKYQHEIKVWLYSRQLCLWFVSEDELDTDKEYDAFISFSHKDEEFVEKEIVAKLEGGPSSYKLCLHYRDWLAGEWIPLQISRSVEESRRTIVILTPNFLESVWGLMEFRAAHTQALKEGRTRMIVILFGDIGNVDDLDQEMKDYLRLNTYIKWGDPWFWDKLKYALPHAKDFAKAK